MHYGLLFMILRQLAYRCIGTTGLCRGGMIKGFTSNDLTSSPAVASLIAMAREKINSISKIF